MSRSLKKGPYVDEKLIKKIQNLKAGEDKVINTWARSSTISPQMVGFRFGVHDGRKHVPVLIVEDMVGHKLGEFAPTRKFLRHGGRMAREEEKAAVTKQAVGETKVAPTPEKKKE